MPMMKEPRGLRNNNPLNIRKGNNWQGERPVQTDSQFEQFESIEYGIRAAFKLLRNYMNGFGGKSAKFDTVELVVKRWAPPSENNTSQYIKVVADAINVDPRQRLSFKDRNKMVDLLQAMARQECGVEIDRALFQSAYDML